MEGARMIKKYRKLNLALLPDMLGEKKEKLGRFYKIKEKGKPLCFALHVLYVMRGRASRTLTRELITQKGRDTACNLALGHGHCIWDTYSTYLASLCL